MNKTTNLEKNTLFKDIQTEVLEELKKTLIEQVKQEVLDDPQVQEQLAHDKQVIRDKAKQAVLEILK